MITGIAIVIARIAIVITGIAIVITIESSAVGAGLPE